VIQITSKLAENNSVKLFLQQAPKMFQEVLELAIYRATGALQSKSKKIVPLKWQVEKGNERIKESRILKASAEKGRTSAELYLRGNKIPLLGFESVSRRDIMGGKTSGGVTVSIRGTSHKFRHSFISNMTGRSVGIYERIRGKKIKTKDGIIREATRHLSSASFASMSKSKLTDAPKLLQEFTQEVFENEFIKECDKRLAAMGAK